MAFNPFSAKQARITSNTGKTVTAKKWTVNFTGDKLDTSNFESGGFYTYISGLIKLDITIELDWDAQAAGAGGGNPFDAGGPILVPGTTVPALKLYLNKGQGADPFWNVASFVVESANSVADVKGVVTLTITGSATGTFVAPTGAAA
jgi:hypothetical protein